MTLPRVVTSRRKGIVSDSAEAFQDFLQACVRWRLWFQLAVHDIAAKYRGSILGPFWITLTTAAFVLGVGLFYSQVVHESFADYVPWLGVSIVVWTYFSTTLIEGCDTFIASGGIIKQTALPMFTFLLRTVMRNLIVLGHSLIVIVGVIIWSGGWRTMNLPLALVGFVLATLNLIWMALLCGIASARFRDVPQIVAAVLQILLFMSAVFWKPESIKQGRYVLTGNPLFHMLEVTRRPLLGQHASNDSYAIVLGFLVVGWIVTFYVFSQTRRRVVHYL